MDPENSYQMIHVGDKAPTARTCVASGKLIAPADIIRRIQHGELPKGNVLPMAEAAGIMAVKRTSDLLPLCHPLSIESAQVRFQFEATAVRVFCEVRATEKTGVEMEALTGVSAALLCIYDLTKGIYAALEISDLHLIRKEGGKSGVWVHPKEKENEVPLRSKSPGPWSKLSFSVLTLSDRCFQGLAQDLSGPTMVDFGKNLGARLHEFRLVSDDPRWLKEAVQKWISENQSDLILCTGGTGLGPRDITPETLAEMGGKRVPGVGEWIRQSGSRYTENAWLSRADAFRIQNSLVICLPGSVKAVTESLDALASMIPHAVKMIRGDHHG